MNQDGDAEITELSMSKRMDQMEIIEKDAHTFEDVQHGKVT